MQYQVNAWGSAAASGATPKRGGSDWESNHDSKRGIAPIPSANYAEFGRLPDVRPKTTLRGMRNASLRLAPARRGALPTWAFLGLVGWGATGCSPDAAGRPAAGSDGTIEAPASQPERSSADGTNSPAEDGGVDPAASTNTDATSEPEAPACVPGPGATGRPKSVVEVVELVNSLPMPVTLPCFLRSLERPLSLLATSSVISAQPAQGQDDPRLFIISDELSLSIVTKGDGMDFLEIGEITAPNRSIKGEILFPVEAPIALDVPFKRIEFTSQNTVCYACHYPEEPVADYPVAGAFVSTAYRPIPRLEINFDYVKYQFTTCDHAAQPERCAMLAAIFDQGEVSRGEFPELMPTFE